MTKTYDGTGSVTVKDRVYSAQETQDGGYILTGCVDCGFGIGKKVFLIKTDSLGDTLWTKTYGDTTLFQRGYSVIETQDGGYIIAGVMGLMPIWDVYVIKTDSQGDTLWTKTYGGSSWDEGHSIQETQDEGYIIAGWTKSFGPGDSDVYLIKTDSLGTTLWENTYGSSGSEWGHFVQVTSDGGYIVTGCTDCQSAPTPNVYLIRANPWGFPLWERNFGGPRKAVGNSVQQTSDGGFIIIGWIGDFPNRDVYLIKTDSLGNVVVGIEETNNEYRIPNFEFRLLQNHPNPFYTTTLIHYSIPVDSRQQTVDRIVSLKIYDMTGRFVETLVDEVQKPGFYQIPITSDQFPGSGIYFYRLKSGEFISTKKLILLH